MESAPLRTRLVRTRALDLDWGSTWTGALLNRVVTVASLGVGKVNTAAGLALLLPRLRPAAVLQLGIGGAFAESGLEVGDVAVAASEVHTDTGVGEGDAWLGMEALGFPLLRSEPPRYNAFPTDAGLSRQASATAGVPLVPFATSERVTATFAAASLFQQRFGVAVESMEGAAAAQVCLALGVRFLELRGISNVVGERDKGAWNVTGAVRAVNDAVYAVLSEAAFVRVLSHAAAVATDAELREGEA